MRILKIEFFKTYLCFKQLKLSLSDFTKDIIDSYSEMFL